MRFAVATDDGAEVARHTGRCRRFMIFDAENGAAIRRADRENQFTEHVRGHHQEDAAEHAPHGGHAHDDLLKALSDCQALVSRGMGPRLVQDLEQHGITPHVCDVDSVDAAAERFAQGKLPRLTGPGAACRHG